MSRRQTKMITQLTNCLRQREYMAKNEGAAGPSPKLQWKPTKRTHEVAMPSTMDTLGTVRNELLEKEIQVRLSHAPLSV